MSSVRLVSTWGCTGRENGLGMVEMEGNVGRAVAVSVRVLSLQWLVSPREDGPATTTESVKATMLRAALALPVRYHLSTTSIRAPLHQRGQAWDEQAAAWTAVDSGVMDEGGQKKRAISRHGQPGGFYAATAASRLAAAWAAKPQDPPSPVQATQTRNSQHQHQHQRRLADPAPWPPAACGCVYGCDVDISRRCAPWA